jgi:hypothetical protein
MNPDFDVIIVGSGPSGVSAAFPLMGAGLRVLMVDGGIIPTHKFPIEDYISWRSRDPNQFGRMVGGDYHALKIQDGDSPKLRVPSLAYVFDRFKIENQINSNGFIAVGSFAPGGLSNAWGCGVAQYSNEELASFPFPELDINKSYGEVASRIGISGGCADEMSSYFGLDQWCQPPIDLDDIHRYLLQKFEKSKDHLMDSGFRLGRTRLAVLSRDFKGRQGCSLTGNCLWGCYRKSMYSSSDELPELMKFSNFKYLSGFNVEEVYSNSDGCVGIKGKNISQNSHEEITASKIMLGAGTLATTRLTYKMLGYLEPFDLLSCPTAAFMMWVPRYFGQIKKSTFGSGQLAFNIKTNGGVSAYGATFPTTAIPVSEFVSHMPLGARASIRILRNILSSCLIGNVFLPGIFGGARGQLDKLGGLNLSYSKNPLVDDSMRGVYRLLKSSYAKLGGVLLPGSFTVGRPGGDIHYSGSIPMRLNPKIGETDPNGVVMGAENIHIIDGACLPLLSEKPHTLTIMANANRIAKLVANELKEQAI